MKNFLKIKSVLSIIIGSFFALIFFSEIKSINENITDYVNVYHISKDATEWKYQSIANFQTWNLLVGGGALIYIGMNVMSLFTKQVKIKFSVLFFDCLLLVIGVINFIVWAFSGFDH